MGEEKVDEGARSFARFIQLIDDGVAEAEASDELHKVVQTLEAHAEENGSAKGQITLVINLNLGKKQRMDVTYELKSKTPKKARAVSPFWVSVKGFLTNKHPRQLDLGLKEVPRRRDDDDDDDRRASHRA